MSAFNKVTQDSLDSIQVNAGVILRTFNPAEPAEPADEDIVCATTGGITVNCTPSFEDFGADIDNCPNNVVEMKRITDYECTFSFTALDVTPESIKLALGAATAFSSEVKARRKLNVLDFETLWFVSERVDDKIVAIQLTNALSTGGLQLKTQKNGKGQLSVTLTGHVKMDAADDVPMKFYVLEGVKGVSGHSLDDEYDEP